MMRRIAVTAGASVVAVVVMLLTTAQPAAAHNCGSLSDCLPSGKAILIALAAVLIIAGILAIGFGGGALLAPLLAPLFGGGGLALAGGGVLGSAGAISAVTAVEIAGVGVLSTTAGVMVMANAQSGGGGGGGGPRGDRGGGGLGGPERDGFRLDSSGKLHTPDRRLPERVPQNWTRSELEQLADDLRTSITNRKAEQVQLGEHGPHRARIAEEERFLRMIEKILSGT